MCYILGVANGDISVADVQAMMIESWKCIKLDRSFSRYLPPVFAKPCDTMVQFVIDQGGLPLLTMWVLTAIHVPQLWNAEGVSTDVYFYSELREQLDSFLVGDRGFENCERYLMSVARSFRDHGVEPMPQTLEVNFVPRLPLQPTEEVEELDSEEEKRIKTDHHCQLHLRESAGGSSSEQIEVTMAVSSFRKHSSYINKLLAIIFRCYNFSLWEAGA